MAVGRSITNRQPQLAFTPAGEALVLWQSGGVLRVAARAAGRSVWTVETIASFSEEIQPPRLFVDHGGRAIAIWTGVDTVNARALLASTRSVAGVWSAAVPLAIAPTQASMAIDTDGDVTVAYRARTDLSATTLLSGASSWSPAVEISGSDDVYGDVQLAGGGERTFLATWGLTQPSSSQNMQPIVRSARLRAAGTWSPPRDVVSQSSDPLLSGVTYEEGWESAVDGLGNAVTFLRFPILTYGYALAVTRLPASGDEWAGPVPFSLPDLKYAAVSLPSTALADDGATSLAFVQRAPSGVTMRVSTSAGAGEAWAGPVGMVGTVTKCKARCESDFGEGIEPVVAIGKRFAIVAIQSAGGEVVAFARSAPGGHWKGPQTLRSTGPTTAYLVSAHVRKGVIRVVVACGLAVHRCRRSPGLPGRRSAPARARPVLTAGCRCDHLVDHAARLDSRTARTGQASAHALRVQGPRRRWHDGAGAAHDPSARLRPPPRRPLAARYVVISASGAGAEATASRTATLTASLSVGCANVVASSGPRSPLRVCSGIVSVASMSPAWAAMMVAPTSLPRGAVDHDLDEALRLAHGARLADLPHELDVHVCTLIPASRASASVKPTAATSGSVNVTRGMPM